MPDSHCVVIDPAVKTAELECYNELVNLSPLKLSYHLPALFGFKSLERVGTDLTAIIILGSHSSVYDRLPWQARLADWIRPLLEKGVPTLGLCFGHQFLAHLYGGKVGFASADHAKFQGVRKVRLIGSRLWTDGEGELYASHREVVTSLPSGFRQIASTATDPFEGLEHETLPIYSLQSHPEAVPGTDFGRKLVKTFLESSLRGAGAR